MAEEGNNREFRAHSLFLTFILPERSAGLRRHVVHDTDPQTETTTTTTETGGGGIIGTVKSYLGLDDKTTASIQDAVASAADSVLPESIKPEAVKGAAEGTSKSSTDPSTDHSTGPSTDLSTDPPADPSTDPSTDKSEAKEAEEAKSSAPAVESNDGANDNEKDAAADDGEKTKMPTTTSDTRARENPESIPTAGGQKLGEEHWGESKVVPENPKPQEEETDAPGIASAAGQPTDQVRENTAQNVGGATAGPPPPTSEASAATSPTRSSSDPEKKTKFLDKLKNKLKKDKS